MTVSRRQNRRNHPDLYLNGDMYQRLTHLGVTNISSTLSLSYHINAAIAKQINGYVSFEVIKLSYHEIAKVLDYGDIINDPCLKFESEAAALVCTCAFCLLLNELGCEKMETRSTCNSQKNIIS